MKALLGAEAEAFFQALEQPSPVSIRYNPKKLDPPGNQQVPWCPMGRYLESRPSFTRDPLFHAGGYYVQEASSMLLEEAIKQAIDTARPLVALDLCAAPGGKSTHMLSILSCYSLLVSNEVIRSRANILIENIEKWGHPNTIVTQNDPSDFSALDSYFDLILVDAPCSGEGLFRKNAGSQEEWSPKNVELCASRQRRILADIWGSLKPGGVLVYSTCTYNRKENDENLGWLQRDYPCEFLKLKLNPAWGIRIAEEGGIIGHQCLPHLVRGEGFFLSVIRKPGHSEGKTHRTKDKLVHPSSMTVDVVSSWITNPTDMFFFQHGVQVRALPVRHRATLQLMLERLHVLQAGTALGEIKKNKIVPDHGLALSIYRSREQLSIIDASLDQALAYLRMEPLRLNTPLPGFTVVEYMGLGLGWINVLPGRINSLFPSNRRVRLAD